MKTISRAAFIQRLEQEWGSFIRRYQALDPARQADYLARQGYASLGDLLAHIICWWDDGRGVVEAMRGKPEIPLAQYDVDPFNARAVEKFAGTPEAQMIALFDSRRAALLTLVRGLSGEEIQQANINTRLYYEILMHWKEHELA